MFTYEVDISNDLGDNMKKNSVGKFELYKSLSVEKIINHVKLSVSASLKLSDTLAVKKLLYKYESSLGIKCV